MYTVVIPTMFRVDMIYKTIMTLSAEDLVGEIILVDNSTGGRRFSMDKLVHVVEGRNTYVNPAWNKAVAMASHDKVCLLNDDVSFDWSFLGDALPLLTPSNGFIGMHPDNIAREDTGPHYDGGLSLQTPYPDGKTRAGHRPEHWGTCIMFDRSNWDPIPDDMLVWGGDDWLFYRCPRQNFVVRGLVCRGHKSATVDSVGLGDITTRDMQNMAGHVRRGEIDNYLLGTIWWQ